MYDLGSKILNIDQEQYAKDEFVFTECSFIVIDELITLFIVFKDKGGQYHYVFLNDNTYDSLYDFTQVSSLNMNGMIVNPSDEVKKIDSVKSLDSISIAMTDYGFWDIEPNSTNHMTYSYRGEKNFGDYEKRNTDVRKLIHPTTVLGDTDKIVEYDKVWERKASTYQTESNICRYSCQSIVNCP